LVKENKYWYLRNHKLFEQLESKDIESLCIISNLKNGRKNDFIFFTEEEVKKIYFLKVGIVKICREDSTGKEIITEILTQGDIFGFTGEGAARLEYAKVISDEARLCFFEYANFKNVLKENPLLSLNYSAAIQDKLLLFQQKYEDLIFKDVETRVKDFFNRYAKHHGKVKKEGVEMEMLLTHQDIADYTASSRQSVTTIINKLVEDGKLIYEGRKKVIIPSEIIL